MKTKVMSLIMAVFVIGGKVGFAQGRNSSGADYIDYAGYSNCIQLQNENVRVVLGPHCGGRVLEYAWNGQNSLYLDKKQDGWIYGGSAALYGGDPYGGRFDIGPEMTIPKHPDLWLGPWKGEITGPRACRLTSQPDKDTGVQLVREFYLDEKTSRLRCTQIIKNVSGEVREYCHWSRTLAVGGGICVIPLTETPKSRFPNSYIMYAPGAVMQYRPEDPKIRKRDGFIEITGTPAQPKLGFDSYAGWLGYLTPNNLLFVKKFPVYPNKVYNEMAAITLCIYYFQEKFVELEPIGPREVIKPGSSASFTEEWWLFPYQYPKDSRVDLKILQKFIKKQTK